MDVLELRGRLERLRSRNAERDLRMRRIQTARMPGGLSAVFPEMFPQEGPYREPMVANMVDVAARDTSEVIAPLPAFNCASSLSVSDRARSFAEKRTKIAYGYVEASNLQVEMYTAADRYVTYGFVPGIVQPDLDRGTPIIRFLDSMGCYAERDRWNRVQRLFQVVSLPRDVAARQFPELIPLLERQFPTDGDGAVEVVRVHDAQADTLFTTLGDGVMLRRVPNPMGECLAHVFQRPGLTDDTVGQFDDVLAVQVAKARFALLALEAAQKAVQAPIALPSDVQEFGIGPDTVIRTANPERIRRISLELPQSTFAEQGALDEELRRGARYPEVRSGNTDASIVTGRGVQALMVGFDTQVKTAQAVFAPGLQWLVSRCFAMDEKLWGSTKKTLRGNANGTPYEITYTPGKDINGDHSVEVQYGLMAGLNPNQALVFGLQARGDKLISRDFLRRQMPFALDATQEEQKVDIEEMREALKQAVSGYAQAIPVLAQAGQDPAEILTRMSAIIEDRQKGAPIEKAVTEAFAPPEPPPAPPGMAPMDPSMAGQPSDMMQFDPMAAAMGQPTAPQGGIEGMDPTGRLVGVAPGQAGLPPGGRPDLQTLLAGLTSGGDPNLSANISRRLPI